MARPQRNNVDYFPFLCEEGKKMFYLEDRYGNDGFATFVKLLRELAKTNYHYLDLSNNITLMFLSAKCKVSKDVLLNIINDLVELEKFDRVLWTENNIVWCQDFIDSIEDAYSKRINDCITYNGLLQHLVRLGIRKQDKCISEVDINPQSKEEYTKEDKGQKLDFDKLLEFINYKTNRKFRTISESVKGKYKARLKEGYLKNDIMRAVENACKVEMHKENGCQYLTPEFFSRANKLDLYGNETAKKIEFNPNQQPTN